MTLPGWDANSHPGPDSDGKDGEPDCCSMTLKFFNMIGWLW